ncbi:MAG: hypothetical protein ACI4TF_10855 [Oliverpabstia sp.]
MEKELLGLIKLVQFSAEKEKRRMEADKTRFKYQLRKKKDGLELRSL